ALNISFPLPLSNALAGKFFPIDTTAATGNSSLTARLKWQGATPNVTHELALMRDLLSGGAIMGDSTMPATGPQPFTMTVGNVPPGVSSFFYWALGRTSAAASS